MNTNKKVKTHVKCPTYASLSFASLHQLNHGSEVLLNLEISKIHLLHAQSCTKECGFLHRLKDALTLGQHSHVSQSKLAKNFQQLLHNLDNQPEGSGQRMNSLN